MAKKSHIMFSMIGDVILYLPFTFSIIRFYFFIFTTPFLRLTVDQI